jgi:hypothetical protein
MADSRHPARAATPKLLKGFRRFFLAHGLLIAYNWWQSSHLSRLAGGLDQALTT